MKIHLGVKANVLVVGVLGALLAAILILLHSSLAEATARTGRTAIAQEVEVIQYQIARMEQDVLDAAHLLATSPVLLTAVQSENPAVARTTILLEANRFGFDNAVVVNPNGERFVNTNATDPAAMVLEDKLLTQALLGINAVGVIAAGDESQLALAVALPLNKVTEGQTSALLVSRILNPQFLDELNLTRQSVRLALLNNNRVLAASSKEADFDVAEEQSVLLHDQASIAQALRGQTIISEALVTSDALPHALAYLPFTIKGKTEAVLGILVNAGELVATQNQLTTNLTLLFTILALAAVSMMALFTRRVITGPIRDLQEVAERMARGDYEQRAAVRTQDEIGQLATALNTTAEAVEEREASLQQAQAALEQRRVELEQNVVELRHLIGERDQLSLTIRELSSPVLPVLDGILVMPLIGAIDTNRAALLTQSLLATIERNHARVVILDVTGVPIIDSQVAQALLQTADAVRLLGAQAIVVGLRPELAQTIVGLNLPLSRLVTCADLRSGVLYALQRYGGAELRSYLKIKNT